MWGTAARQTSTSNTSARGLTFLLVYPLALLRRYRFCSYCKLISCFALWSSLYKTRMMHLGKHLPFSLLTAQPPSPGAHANGD